MICTCDQCGNTFERRPSHIARSEHNFCNAKCYGAWFSEHKSGANNPNWKGGLPTSVCAQCGAPIKKLSHQLARCEHHFCNAKCHGAWLSEHYTGENNPSWRGGATTERGKWEQNGAREFNAGCRRRDAYTCQLCGKVFDKRSKALHVHHKASFAEYPDLRSEEANGICLCKRCHLWIHSNEGTLLRLRWEQDALTKGRQ